MAHSRPGVSPACARASPPRGPVSQRIMTYTSPQCASRPSTAPARALARLAASTRPSETRA
ncbi:hypothetical protein G6O69_08025 [Pseudenhygromyxa sp. WMMC2535]|uniref:hypothetical protein n=1 Tax=Pseudenhygromyxa sp. WMMC2535 TaxID=2712867 RepID=UPI00159556C5|nr:hypothetical protein [Pseudenhygromyxa sp. WMMC2535]NVB37777.1 hypothetical protein [Pseudenhygromyxa sp. WMMC2535]